MKHEATHQGMDMSGMNMDHGAMPATAPAPKQDRSAGIQRSRLKPVFLSAKLDGRQEVQVPGKPPVGDPKGSATGLIRTEVGRQTGLRHTPSLTFVRDTLPEGAQHMEDLVARARAADAALAAAREGAQLAGDPDPYRPPAGGDGDEEPGAGPGSPGGEGDPGAGPRSPFAFGCAPGAAAT